MAKNKQMKKNVALLAGGFSGEYDISVQSAATIAAHLDPARYRVFTILITREKWYYRKEDGGEISIDKNDFSLNTGSEKIHFDVVFFAIHGTPGEDGRLQGYFDMLGIPYTGCGVPASALTFNKSYCNKVVAALGIVKVAHSLHLFHDQPYDLETITTRLKLPVFVKPAESGSSLGMSKVTDKEALPAALRLAFDTDRQVLIEELVKGRELSCGVYKTEEGLVALSVTEIRSLKDFFDYEAKYTPGLAEEITPAPVPDPIFQKVQDTAKALYPHLNCRGIVRFDFIWEEGGDNLYFLEVNTMPGQSPGSIVPKQIKAAGLAPGKVYEALIKESFAALS